APPADRRTPQGKPAIARTTRASTGSLAGKRATASGRGLAAARPVVVETRPRRGTRPGKLVATDNDRCRPAGQDRPQCDGADPRRPRWTRHRRGFRPLARRAGRRSKLSILGAGAGAA